MERRKFIKGLFLTSAGGIGWGISGVCGQYLFMEYYMDSAWLTAVRMVLSGILPLLLALMKKSISASRFSVRAKISLGS